MLTTEGAGSKTLATLVELMAVPANKAQTAFVHPLNQRVEQALSEWSERRQRLQDTSKALAAALAA
jgi:hypothetical protein